MTNTFALTALSLAQRSYRRLGILPSGGVPTDDQFEQFLIVYNSAVLGLQAEGPSLYRLTQVSWTIPTGVGFPGTPFVTPFIIMGLPEARWVVTPPPNLFEREMAVVPYMDYMQLPNKLQDDQSPVQVCIDKQVTQTNLYFWPLPTFGGTFNATVVRQANSISAPTDPIDLPQEWSEGISYLMADKLMDDEGVAAADQVTADRISKRAIAFEQTLLNWDRPVSIYIRPWGRAGAGRFYRGR
jgi:hypothetical protein